MILILTRQSSEHWKVLNDENGNNIQFDDLSEALKFAKKNLKNQFAFLNTLKCEIEYEYYQELNERIINLNRALAI